MQNFSEAKWSVETHPRTTSENLKNKHFRFSEVPDEQVPIKKIYSRRHKLSLLPPTIVHRAKRKGGERMSPSERGQELLRQLAALSLHIPVPGESSRAVMPPENTAHTL